MSPAASKKGRVTASATVTTSLEGCAAATHGDGRLRSCWSVLQPYAVAAHARTHGTAVGRRRGGARQADQSPLGADGRALHLPPMRERPHLALASCRPLRQTERVCAGARVSLMQWQDWRSGGRDLGSATRVGTLVGVRVRFVAGGEKQGQGYGEGRLRVTARLSVARQLRAWQRSFAQLVERLATARCGGACPHARDSWVVPWRRAPTTAMRRR